MKSIVIALVVCIPILLLVAAAHLYPQKVRGAIYLAEWEFKMERDGVKPPPIIGEIRCETSGTCTPEGTAFTALLRQRFPAGTPERELRAVLIDQNFLEAGLGGAEYDWPSPPCVNSVRVTWSSRSEYGAGEYTRKITAIGGTYTLHVLKIQNALPAPPLQSISPVLMTSAPAAPILKSGNLLGIEGLSAAEVTALLDLAETYVALNRGPDKKAAVLKGRTLINLFYEFSTRTQSSFELAGKRLGADVLNMSVKTSSVSKGETLIDTASTLNAMRPDILVVRHQDSGAAELLSRKLDCSVINAGDGSHEHPTQALLDALTIRRRLGGFENLTVAICGDVLHSRVARSNLRLLAMMGAQVRLIAPATLLPTDAERFGVQIFTDMRQGLAGADIVMMLRLQLERMSGAFVPSAREYFHFYGLDRDKLNCAKPGALVMHPGPMNWGIEIASDIADDIEVSLIQEQVEMGVAIRMAVLDALARGLSCP